MTCCSPEEMGLKLFTNHKDHIFLCRTLTDRQRALLTSYAEDESEVEGTVNGVTNTTTGKRTTTLTLTFSLTYLPVPVVLC